MNIKVSKCRRFSHEHDYGAFSVVRVSNDRLASLGGRNTWLTISSKEVKIYRRVLGSGNAGLPQIAIELDYDSRAELGIKDGRDAEGFYDCDLSLSPSTLLERAMAHLVHPSLAYRVPYQLALLGVAFSLVSLLIAMFSLLR